MYESLWQELVEYYIPRRGGLVPSKGTKYGSKLFDSTSTMSAENLAAALNGMLTNPAIPWANFYIPDSQIMAMPEVQRWLYAVAEIVFLALDDSNFETRTQEVYLDLVVLAFATMFLDNPPKNSPDDPILNFTVPHFSEVYLAQNSKGVVDTVYRKYKFTLRQAVQEWGDGVHKDVKDKVQTKPEDEVEVLHCVYPRKDRDPSKLDGKNMPFVSAYIDLDHKHQMSEGGYNEFPWMCPRWSVLAGEVYGRGPGHTALADTKQLQAIRKTVLKASQKAVDPPLQVPDRMMRYKTKLTPGAINYYQSGSNDRIEGMPFNPNINLGFEMEEQCRKSIREIFLNDKLELGTNNPQMTATEIMKRSSDQLRILGPTGGRLQKEMFAVMFKRIIGILGRARMFPPMPPVLQDKYYMVEYVSPIAKARKQVEVQSIARWLDMMSPFMEAYPQVLEGVNPSQLSRITAEDMGVPKIIFYSPDELAQIKAQKAAAQERATSMEEGAALAKGVKDVGTANPQNLSDIAGLIGLGSGGNNAPPAPAEENF